ncbi:MAG: YraN family protein [Bacillota bacterium]
MSRKQSLGKKGEEVARAFLESRGYKVETVNYRTPAGEIDIVARDKAVMVFVEVKTRKSLTFGLPYEAVHFHKQAKIRRVAMQYLAEKAVSCRGMRFDVISILISPAGDYQIEHLVNAF